MKLLIINTPASSRTKYSTECQIAASLFLPFRQRGMDTRRGNTPGTAITPSNTNKKSIALRYVVKARAIKVTVD